MNFVVLFKSIDKVFHTNFSELHTLAYEWYMIDKNDINVYNSSLAQ